MSRRRKKRTHEDVQLNMAAMLDMAFQLLTFFILTFQPTPIEAQISLRMPDPTPLAPTTPGHDIGKDEKDKSPLANLDQPVVSVTADKQGDIKSITVHAANGPPQPPLAPSGTTEVKLAALRSKLAEIFGASAKIDQMALQVGSGVRYEEVMKIVDICARQQLKDGKRLSKLTFTELPDGSFK